MGRFWYFDVSKVSGGHNFAFRRYSNIEHLLLHTRPEHSYTPSDAAKPNKHTYTSLKSSQTPNPDIYGQFMTTKVTDRHRQTSQHIPKTPIHRHPKRVYLSVQALLGAANSTTRIRNSSSCCT